MKSLSIVLITVSLAGADVVIDDFNDSYKGQTTQGWRLGPTAKAGYWYGYNDWNHGKTGLGTTMIPDVVNADTGFTQALGDDCGAGSPCLHVKFIGGTGYAYPFSGVGFNFLREGTDVNLSTMDSITFRAKGKGSFRFKLMTKHITDDFDRKNYWADMGKTYRLTAVWKNYTLSVDDILPQAGAPLADTATWQECADHTRKIHLTTSEAFKAHDTLDFWIDDIVMHGVSPAVFGGSWNEDSAAGISGSQPERPNFVKRVGSRLECDSRRFRRLDFLDGKGNKAVSLEGGDGALPLAELPRGVWVVRAVLHSGSVVQARFVNLR
jgi:hypothetical protein